MEPALTREEWHEGYVSPGLSVTVRPSMSTPGMRVHVTVRDEPLGGALGDPRDIHALAALCLHRQPFGFTRQDHVDEIAAYHDAVVLSRHYQDSGMDPERIACVYRAERHLDRADRIEALLPPED